MSNNTQAKGWIKAGSYSLLGYAAQLGLAFVSFLLLVRMLPKHEFGVWTLFTTIVTFAEMGRTGLLQNAVIKFMTDEAAEAPDILRTGLRINTATSLLMGGLLLALGVPLARLFSAPELPQLLLWYTPWALSHGTARYLDFPHMLHHDFRGIFWSKVAFGAAFLLGIALLWQRAGHLPLWQLSALQGVAGLPALAVMLLYNKGYCAWGRYSAAWAAKIVQFGKYVLGTNISSMLFNKMDVLMIGALLSPEAVALYNVPVRLVNLLEVPMSGISQVIYPKIASANSTGKAGEVSGLYEKSIAVIVAMILPIVVVVMGLSEWFIVLLADERYLEAAPLLNILLPVLLIKPWARLSGLTLDALGKPHLNMLLLLAVLALSAVLNLVLIPWMGLAGAAVAAVVAMIVLVVAGQLIMDRILPISQQNILRQILHLYTHPRQILDRK